MIFHENRLLADDSHVILYLIFVENWEKMSQNLSSATVVIGALRVKAPAKKNTLLVNLGLVVWGFRQSEIQESLFSYRD